MSKKNGEGTIYLLFSCNKWKEHTSMSLVMATTYPEKILAGIDGYVKKDEMEYGDGSRKKQRELLKQDFLKFQDESLLGLNNLLQYGYLEIVKDGEIQ